MKSKAKTKWMIGCGIFVFVLAAAFLILPGHRRSFLLGPEGEYFDSAGVRFTTRTRAKERPYFWYTDLPIRRTCSGVGRDEFRHWGKLSCHRFGQLGTRPE